MKCFIGMGSNLGDRRASLEAAARELGGISRGGRLRLSPIYENPALVPSGAPMDWHLSFLNAVAEIEWEGSPLDLLRSLKRIESARGRAPAARWAPRILDLDLLTFGNEVVRTEDLTIPHPGMRERSFVLGPLKDLAPSFVPPGWSETVLRRFRSLAETQPLWMGICNVTPDSFSDGGKWSSLPDLTRAWRDDHAEGVSIFDVGAESTRPGALTVEPQAEWARLAPVLAQFRDVFPERPFRPILSVDTRNATVAAKAIEAGADWINDVAGSGDPAFLDVMKSSDRHWVLMHSLTVPADPRRHLPLDQDPVEAVRRWAEERLEFLDRAGFPWDRVLLDPGLGFGKTALQSRALLRGVDRLLDLPVRLLVGHSRKSFLNLFTKKEARERDPESLGVSLGLAGRGVDVLRVHEPALHARAFRAWSEVRP